ncbi:hypothetical protein MUP38_03070, partial [Candidatus Bathyarchaeota archaeon]|nr:hypothetical protein [Candidatus Bathyarchaeota archaeon]
MRTINKKQAIVSILVLAFFSSLVLAPNTKALNLTYSNAVWTSLTISGPDQTKPGNTETYTISGSLGNNMS